VRQIALAACGATDTLDTDVSASLVKRRLSGETAGGLITETLTGDAGVRWNARNTREERE